MRVVKKRQKRQVREVLHPRVAERVVKPGPGTAVHQCIVEPARSREVSGVQREVREPWAEKYLGISVASPPKLFRQFSGLHRPSCKPQCSCVPGPASESSCGGEVWPVVEHSFGVDTGLERELPGGQPAGVNCACAGCKSLAFPGNQRALRGERAAGPVPLFTNWAYAKLHDQAT